MKEKTIKAWAIADKDSGKPTKEAMPNWGRFWIFETRKQARDEVNSRFYHIPYNRKGDRIVPIEIKLLNPHK